MSTQKGNASRTRSQKYKNNSVFKNDKYDKTAKTQMLNGMTVANVCERCRSVIEWKIKYKKYKTLTAPRKCVRCEQKCVKHAYHTMCYPCARDLRVCPKCGVKAEIKPVEEDQTKLDVEMQQLLKDLPERKRRTFLRFLAAKKDSEDNPDAVSVDGSKVAKPSAPSLTVKEELTAKLNELKLATDKDGDDFGFSDDDSDFDHSGNSEEEDDDNK